MKGRQYLFQNATSNGSSPVEIMTYPSGHVLLTAWGTWNGANMTFFTVLQDGTLIPITDPSGNVITISANAQYPISYFAPNEQIQAVLANAGGATVVNCTIMGTSSGL